ncbi:hypothetical protein MRBLMI1x_000773 [Microbacterium sp. LMI1x-1-1.1]
MIMCQVSPLYSWLHDSHRVARRLPHRVKVMPSGSFAEEYSENTSPVAS